MKELSKEEQAEIAKQESAFAQMGKQVLDNAAFKQAMVTRKAQIFDLFCSTKPDQSDVREMCYLTMVNMLAFEEYFRTAMETGKMADMTLESHKEESK